MHFYVYILRNGRYLYERTCGTRVGAEDRVDELRKRGVTAVWLQDHLIKGAFY